MIKKIAGFLFLSLLTGWSSSSQAIDCARASTVVENTICDTPRLVWLDSVLNDAYRNAVMNPSVSADKDLSQWRRSRDACASNTCLLQAYMQGIGQLFNAGAPFDWQGEWWNGSAIHGNGGKIIIKSATAWGFNFDASIWGGAYKSSFRGDARIYYGVGFTDGIAWGDKCAVVLIPRPDGKMEVSSDSRGSCRLLTPGGIAIDGTYIKSAHDPRPPATLLSVGVFPTKALDERFRALVGKDYPAWVAIANNVVYDQDLDNIGATVLKLSVKGRANTQTALIMYTPEGKIWAMRITPDKEKGREMQFVTTEKEQTPQLKTLTSWRALFMES